MKLSFVNDSIVALVAHPDDAELLCAGTLARAKAECADIAICVCCQGEKGVPSRPVKNLTAVRRREMRAAAKVLGAKVFFLEVPDSDLADSKAVRKKAIEVLRRCRATLVLAHAANDYHSDHRAASALADSVSWFAASRGHKTTSPPLDSPPAVWWMDTINMLGFEPGFFVDVSTHVAVKQEMLACHKSQLARGDDGDFSPLSELMELQYRTRGMQSGVAAAEAFRIHPAFKRVAAF